MTDKEKTGDQLAASVRRSKVSAANKPAEQAVGDAADKTSSKATVAKPAGAKPHAKQTARKSAPRRSSVAKANAPAAATSTASPERATGGYQFGRRIWPD